MAGIETHPPIIGVVYYGGNFTTLITGSKSLKLNSSPEVLNGPETFAPRLVLLRQPSTRPARVASFFVADTQRSPVEVSAAVKAAEFGLHVTPLIIISKRIGY